MNTKHHDLGGKPTEPHNDLLDDDTVFDFDDVVSGEFDAELTRADAAPEKRVLLPQPESPKLHKVLAQSGLGSRIEMERLIAEGHVAVNNEVAHVGQRVQFGDQIKVNGRQLKVRIAPPPPRVIAYHKPAGEVVTTDDPQNRPTVFRRLPRLYQGKWQSVGRLDLNTEGLLLFTSSGELANQLMHPRFGLQREYAVRSLGKLSKEQKEQLVTGIQLDDGPAQFGSIEEGGGEGSNCWYRVTISEGRNREVRRMFEAVGHAVSRLIRIRYGAMVLPRGLKRGVWVELGEDDVRAIRHVIRDWANRADVDAMITTGGTGLTGRDVTIEAVRALFEKEIDGFSTVFHQISYEKVGTSTIQSRATACVARGAQRPLLVVDMPFASYNTPQQAMDSAAQLMRAGAEMVKLEGGEWLAPTVKMLVERGMPVCAHLGLTPQSVHQLGGYRVQGRGEAGEFRVGHVDRGQGHAQVAAAARGDRVLGGAVVEAMHGRLDDHAARDPQRAVQGEQRLLGCIGRREVAAGGIGKARRRAEHVDMRVAGAGRQRQPGCAGRRVVGELDLVEVWHGPDCGGSAPAGICLDPITDIA